MPAIYSEFITSHAQFFQTHHPQYIPHAPHDLTPAEADLWIYLQSGALHLCVFTTPPQPFRRSFLIMTISYRYFIKLERLSLSHGEGWTDVNIWGHLIDKAFLCSDTLSLDRYVFFLPLVLNII